MRRDKLWKKEDIIKISGNSRKRINIREEFL